MDEDEQRTTDEGVPGSEVAFAGGNVLGLILTALGGLWVWVLAAVAAVAVGLAAARSRTGRGRAHGRAGSAGRVGSGRSADGGRRGRLAAGRGSSAPNGRRGRSSGRAGSHRSGPTAGGGRQRAAPGRAGHGPAGAGRKRGASASGGKSRGRGTSGRSGRRLTAPSTWLRPSGRNGKTGRGLTGGAGGRRPGRSWRGTSGWRPPDPGKQDTVLQPTKNTPKPHIDDRPEANPAPRIRPQPHPHRDQQPNTGPSRKGRPIMAKFGRKWRENAEEMSAQAAGYDPDQMPDYLSDLRDLTEAFRNESQAIGRIAATSEADLPVHPALADYIRQMQSLLSKVADDTGEVVSHFNKLHEDDMRRHQQPRPGEQKWNVR